MRLRLITPPAANLGLFAMVLFSVLAPSAYTKELKISPQWTVVVVDMNGAPKAGIEVFQTWSYWMILDDQREKKVTDEQGRAVFPPRSTSANLIQRKITGALGSLPHAGAPAPAATIRVHSEEFKDLDEYFNAESGFLEPEKADSKTVLGPEGLMTTFRLRPIDLIDAIERNDLKHDFSRAKAILAKDPSSAKMVDILGGTPLHRLYLHNPESTEMAKLLIEAGADIRAADHDGSTPLHVAASHGAWEVVDILLQKGADPNAKTKVAALSSQWKGVAPLHVAVHSAPSAEETIKVIDLLLQHGATINIKDANGQTPLHEASSLGDPSVLSFLIAAGAEVNARDNSGWTPLHVAAFVGSPAQIKILLEKGADKTLRDNKGRMPVDLAKENHRPKNIEALQ